MELFHNSGTPVYKFYKFTPIRTLHVDHIDEIPDKDDTLVLRRR
jgi:hypothetical protein